MSHAQHVYAEVNQRVLDAELDARLDTTKNHPGVAVEVEHLTYPSN